MASSAPAPDSIARHSSIAALASAVVPGWGQLYAGRRHRARRLFIVDIVIVVLTLLFVLWQRLDVLKLWVSSTALGLMMVANLVLLGYRWLAATDAYQAVRDSGESRFQTNLILGAATVVLVLPHLVFGYYTVTQYSLISSVFGGAGTPGPVAAALESTTTTKPEDPVAGEPGTTAPSTTVPKKAELWDGLDRLNIVLLGADAGAGRRGLRTDTTILVSIDPNTGNATMISIPRDMSGVPLPEGMGVWDCQCFPDLITHLYAGAEAHPDAFPGPNSPGINGIKGALSEIFGIPIHYYALVTLDGFVDVIDALGGVTIDIPNTITDETYPHEDGSVQNITIKKGTRHLNGHEALAYARIRRHSNDFARMNRQRCVLEAVVEQSSPTEILFRFGKIADALKRSLQTDIPEDKLADFIDLLPKVSTDRIATLRITRSEYKIGEGDGVVYYDLDRIGEDARALMEHPETAEANLGLDPLDETCKVSSEDPSVGL